MIPEFKFKTRKALPGRYEKRRMKSKMKEWGFRMREFHIRDIDFKGLLQSKKIWVTGAVCAVTVFGVAALAPVGRDTVASDVPAFAQTAGVTTQIEQAEKIRQEQYVQGEVSISKKEGMNLMGTSYLSEEGSDAEAATGDAVTAEAVSEAVMGEATEAAVQVDAATTEAVTEGEQPAEAPAEPVHPVLTGFSNPGIARVDQFVNIRESASESAEICGKLSNNCACEILAEENGWYKIITNGVEGYIKSEFLVTGEEAWQLADQLKIAYARVLTDTLNVRQEANTGSAVVAQVSIDQKLNLLEEQEQWLKVSVPGDNKEGYISKEYIAIEYTLPRGEAVEKESSSKSSGSGSSSKKASDCSSVVSYATSFVGNPYVYGGTSLTNGTDCSGFTMSVYAKFGVYLPHSSAAQANCGTKVSTSDMQPGDLVFYGSGGSISHVALYIGGGQVVHASSAKTGIKISNAFYRTPITVRRVK